MLSHTSVVAPDLPAASLPFDDTVARRPDGSVDQEHYAELARELRAEHLGRVLPAVPIAVQATADWLARALWHRPKTGFAQHGSTAEKP